MVGDNEVFRDRRQTQSAVKPQRGSYTRAKQRVGVTTAMQELAVRGGTSHFDQRQNGLLELGISSACSSHRFSQDDRN